jgi:hypothetical protein
LMPASRGEKSCFRVASLRLSMYPALLHAMLY